MTDNSPYYTTFISKAELAHLRKSQARLRGWTAQYRREIEGLEAKLMKPCGPSYCCDHFIESMDDKLPKWDCIYCHVAELEAQIVSFHVGAKLAQKDYAELKTAYDHTVEDNEDLVRQVDAVKTLLPLFDAGIEYCKSRRPVRAGGITWARDRLKATLGRSDGD